MITDTVITIKLTDRLEFITPMLNSLVKADRINEYLIIASIDKCDGDERVESLLNIYKNHYNLNMHIHKSNFRLGCAGNMKLCFDLSFNNPIIKYMIHIEDDVVLAKDYITYFEETKKYLDDENIFLSVPFRRATRYNVSDVVAQKHIKKLILLPGFDCAGGFLVSRDEYMNIKNMGGVKGWNGKEENDIGSWAYYFVNKFINGRKCIYPVVNRCKNIGDYGQHVDPAIKFYDRIYVDQYSNNFNIPEDNFNILDNGKEVYQLINGWTDV